MSALPPSLTKALAPTNELVAEAEYRGRQLVEAMRAIHGGEWRIKIDHRVQLAIVVPTLRSAREDFPCAS